MALPEVHPRLVRAVEAAIEEHGERGLQVAVYRDDELVLELCAGLADASSGADVTPATLFPVFSATKGVAATALHIQVDRGLLDYEQPIAEYWPAFGVHGKDRATVMDALTHRVGIPQMPEGVTPEVMADWDEMVRRVAALEPVWEPGTRTGYHAYTFGWIVGELVRRTDPRHRPFGQFVREEICAPLGIDDLWIGVPERVEPRIATLIDMPEVSAPGTLLERAIPPHLGTKQAVFGRSDVRRSCHPGAGGITNARGLARLYAALAADGAGDGARLLSLELARALVRYETDAPDEVLLKRIRKGRGFYVSDRDGQDTAALMISRNEGSFGHPGAGGSTAWADTVAGIGVAVLKNRLRPSLLSESGHMLAIRDAIYEALETSTPA